MGLTIDELRNGIKFWRSKTKWPQDFHNTFYEHDLAVVGTNGLFNEQWWSRFYLLLQDWVATRPISRAVLTERARERFRALSERWAIAVAPHMKSKLIEICIIGRYR